MRLVSVGGHVPTATIEGTEAEIRQIAYLLMRDVLVIAALDGPLDANPAMLIARVNHRRIKLGMSWRDVAKALDVGNSTLSRWYAGKSPSARVLLAASKWVGE